MSTSTIPTPAVLAGPSRLTARPLEVSPTSRPGASERAARPGPPAVENREFAATALDMPKLLAARRLAVKTCPYLAVALHAMAIVPTYSVPTMGVDRYWRCYVSPSFVAATEVRELAAVWLHEVSHLVRDHHGRARALMERSVRHEAAGQPGSAPLDPDHPVREQLRLNLAMDLEINDDLLASLTTGSGSGSDADADADKTGPRLPAGAVTPKSLRVSIRELFEEYVRDLTPTMLHDFGHWLDCGSGAHHGSAPWEYEADGAHPLGDYEAAAIRISVRDALKSGRGTAPAGWQRWAERHGAPHQDWRSLLGAAFRSSLGASAGAGDYSYRRPSRRTPCLGGQVVLPSLRRPVPQVAVVVDTSGSVSDADLGTALGEIAAISRAVGVSGRGVSVYSCDAAVHTVQQVCRAEDITLVGGGGTDLRLGIRRAAHGSPRPDVVVVLTDGDTPWPSAQPGCRVIAGILGSSRRPQFRFGADEELIDLRPPEWVETVYLE